MWYRSDAITRVPVPAANTRVRHASLVRPRSRNKSPQSCSVYPLKLLFYSWLLATGGAFLSIPSLLKRHGGSVKHAVVTDVGSLFRKFSREQKRMAQLNNAQLILLSHDLKKENECDTRNLFPYVTHHCCQTGSRTYAHKSPRTPPGSSVSVRLVASRRLSAPKEKSTRLTRNNKDSARHARRRARELLLEMKIQDAR